MTCARCGRRERPDRMVYSRWTKAHYCQDFGACDRRLSRAQRAVAVAQRIYARLSFTCPVCLIEAEDTACPSCGRPLTANDLTPATETAASGAPVTETPQTADRSE